MKKYEAPASEIILLDKMDIISTSVGDTPIVDASDLLEIES